MKMTDNCRNCNGEMEDDFTAIPVKRHGSFDKLGMQDFDFLCHKCAYLAGILMTKRMWEEKYKKEKRADLDYPW